MRLQIFIQTAKIEPSKLGRVGMLVILNISVSFVRLLFNNFNLWFNVLIADYYRNIN